MPAKSESDMKKPTSIERKSDRELVVTRTFAGPARIVFDAWTKPELFKRWWLPKAFGLTLVSIEMDARTGGSYRLMIRHGESAPMAFFGSYTEVTPHSRVVWTNDEGNGQVITTVTFEEKQGKTFVVMHELHPSKQALDDALASQAYDGTNETHAQLDELLAELTA